MNHEVTVDHGTEWLQGRFVVANVQVLALHGYSLHLPPFSSCMPSDRSSLDLPLFRAAGVEVVADGCVGVLVAPYRDSIRQESARNLIF